MLKRMDWVIPGEELVYGGVFWCVRPADWGYLGVLGMVSRILVVGM